MGSHYAQTRSLGRIVVIVLLLGLGGLTAAQAQQSTDQPQQPAAAATEPAPPAAAAPAAAAPAAAPAPKLDSGDTAWMLTSTALVLMMTIPGLALFYGGMVRKKNVLATLMQCFAICCVRERAVDGGRLQPGVHARDGGQRRLPGRHEPLHARRASTLDGLAPLAPTIPESGLHDVPDDVRDHHAGADRAARSSTG